MFNVLFMRSLDKVLYKSPNNTTINFKLSGKIEQGFDIIVVSPTISSSEIATCFA